MRTTSGMREYLAILLVASLPAAAGVTVSYPSTYYSDIGPPGAEADDVKAELARHLQALGVRYLGSGDRLKVEILDVDLAGERQLVASLGRELRIARGSADFPRIVVRYALEGARTLQGEETLSDPSYLWFSSRSRPSETLYHEKRLLETWFKDRFGR
jgi:hypothetical protein